MKKIKYRQKKMKKSQFMNLLKDRFLKLKVDLIKEELLEEIQAIKVELTT